jgi:hypothetical protein
MEVNGVISGTTSSNQTQTTPPTEPAVEAASQEVPQSSEGTEEQENESGKLPGVIRNLLEGHFKGVSDVRLRINHFEALQAIEQEQLQAVIEDNAGLLESIAQNLTELLNYTEAPPAPQEDASADIATVNTEEATASDGLTQEQEEIVVDASGKVDELLGFENQSKDTLLTLVTNLRSTLMALADSLNSPVSSTINETPETPAVSVDDGGEETAGADTTNGEDGEVEADTADVDSPSAYETLVSAFVEELNSVFLGALEELAQSLSEVEVLPELSEPNGNGSAYEKFLALYNELWGSGESNEESPGLDTTI